MECAVPRLLLDELVELAALQAPPHAEKLGTLAWAAGEPRRLSVRAFVPTLNLSCVAGFWTKGSLLSFLCRRPTMRVVK